MTEKKLKLTFGGGTNTVTGANFLLENVSGGEGETQKFLVDCGLIQSTKLADEDNWKDFQYEAKDIDILFITHAHIDHIGRIPKIIHDGFKGRIISTPPTKDIAHIMLEDTVAILSRSHEHDLNKIYTSESISKAMALWETLPYHQVLDMEGGFQFSFKDSGHILGSGMLEIVYRGEKIVFTGDLGNSPSPLLPDTESITDADYLIMESVYGDRNHEDRAMRKKKLESIIEDNYKRKGTLIIPTFSLERTQELLYEINDFVENERIPKMPIFVDSPLAIRLTVIYEKYKSYFNVEAQKRLTTDSDIFRFHGLRETVKTDESKDILHVPNPKIIIAGSGMSNGGRIIHHERNYLPDSNNTLLLIGYQSVGTLGRHIEDGAKTVSIMRDEVPVRAHIEKISGYSGHKDSDHLIQFVEATADRVKKVFVVMGEMKSELFLVQRLRDYLGVNAVAPEEGESVVLTFKNK
ncbi:MAG: MBL fold metallo-hydrolase [Candidatus Pacebacteria bacterium]|nr:MBL fold metallo-hydrolase [Candidatus Paceibacterota bacterium]